MNCNQEVSLYVRFFLPPIFLQLNAVKKIVSSGERPVLSLLCTYQFFEIKAVIVYGPSVRMPVHSDTHRLQDF